MVSSVGTTSILPIADRSPARAIPLQNAYSDRVDQYDTISVHTAVSNQNEQSVQNGAISPRINVILSKMYHSSIKTIATVGILLPTDVGMLRNSAKFNNCLSQFCHV